VRFCHATEGKHGSSVGQGVGGGRVGGGRLAGKTSSPRPRPDFAAAPGCETAEPPNTEPTSMPQAGSDRREIFRQAQEETTGEQHLIG